jgi:hypothetical protein
VGTAESRGAITEKHALRQSFFDLQGKIWKKICAMSGRRPPVSGMQNPNAFCLDFF